MKFHQRSSSGRGICSVCLVPQERLFPDVVGQLGVYPLEVLHLRPELGLPRFHASPGIDSPWADMVVRMQGDLEEGILLLTDPGDPAKLGDAPAPRVVERQAGRVSGDAAA